MNRIRFPVLLAVLAALALGGVSAAAGDDPEEAALGAAEKARIVGAALDVARLRMEARLGQAETLRQMGRYEEALAAYKSVDALYAETRTEIARLIEGLGPRAQPSRPGGVVIVRPPSARVPDVVVEPEAPAGGAFQGRGGERDDAAVGGSQRSQRAVEAALRWLAAHQSPNGGWEAAGFNAFCDGEATTTGPDGVGKAVYDVGVTGLALCAFLGAGYTNRGQHPFAKTVANGLRYLKNVQDNEGCFGPRTTQHYNYNHATAALAMVEAYGMTGSPIFKGSAQKALDFIALSRNPYFVWRYGVKPGDNDTSVTGWMMMPLKSAALVNEEAQRRGGDVPLVIDREAFDGVRAWLDKMTDPDYGRVGYIQRGGSPARPQELIDRFPGERSEAMTAVGVLARIFLGEDPRKSQIVQKGAALMEKRPPTWNPTSGDIDMYYWYYGTLAMFQVGGRAWKTWNQHLVGAVLETQRQDTDPCQYQGSWDPIGPWGPDGGRVYSTALLCMCLEVYYRYARVFGTSSD